MTGAGLHAWRSRGLSLSQSVAGLWAGVVVGGSLIAAPAKFQAVSLTREVGLDVGRAQFHWLGIAEYVLVFAFVLCATLTKSVRTGAVVVAAGSLAVQRLLIMPSLDARTLQIIAGQTVPPSRLHLAYIAVELVKVGVLAALAFGAFKATPLGQRQT